MSDDDFGSEGSEGFKNLRSQYESIKAANEQLMNELNSFRAEKAQATVESVLKEKGIDPKVAKLYNGEASPDAVGQWVTEYADVFGISQANDENAAAAARVSAASFGASGHEAPAAGPNGKVFGDPAELQRLLETLPYPELVKQGLMPDPNKDPYKRPAV